MLVARCPSSWLHQTATPHTQPNEPIDRSITASTKLEHRRGLWARECSGWDWCDPPACTNQTDRQRTLAQSAKGADVVTRSLSFVLSLKACVRLVVPRLVSSLAARPRLPRTHPTSTPQWGPHSKPQQARSSSLGSPTHARSPADATQRRIIEVRGGVMEQMELPRGEGGG